MLPTGATSGVNVLFLISEVIAYLQSTDCPLLVDICIKPIAKTPWIIKCVFDVWLHFGMSRSLLIVSRNPVVFSGETTVKVKESNIFGTDDKC